jgi:hypothetical protein
MGVYVFRKGTKVLFEAFPVFGNICRLAIQIRQARFQADSYLLVGFRANLDGNRVANRLTIDTCFQGHGRLKGYSMLATHA